MARPVNDRMGINVTPKTRQALVDNIGPERAAKLLDRVSDGRVSKKDLADADEAFKKAIASSRLRPVSEQQAQQRLDGRMAAQRFYFDVQHAIDTQPGLLTRRENFKDEHPLVGKFCNLLEKVGDKIGQGMDKLNQAGVAMDEEKLRILRNQR